jgi:hypothetical protein
MPTIICPGTLCDLPIGEISYIKVLCKSSLNIPPSATMMEQHTAPAVPRPELVALRRPRSGQAAMQAMRMPAATTWQHRLPPDARLSNTHACYPAGRRADPNPAAHRCTLLLDRLGHMATDSCHAGKLLWGKLLLTNCGLPLISAGKATTTPCLI